jgi:hypothetical protein
MKLYHRHHLLQKDCQMSYPRLNNALQRQHAACLLRDMHRRLQEARLELRQGEGSDIDRNFQWFCVQNCREALAASRDMLNRLFS